MFTDWRTMLGYHHIMDSGEVCLCEVQFHVAEFHNVYDSNVDFLSRSESQWKEKRGSWSSICVAP